MTTELLAYLTDMVFVLTHFSLSAAERPQTIKNYNQVLKDVKGCANGIKIGTIEKCYNYCEYYKLNANSPVVEGFALYFNTAMNELTKFL